MYDVINGSCDLPQTAVDAKIDAQVIMAITIVITIKFLSVWHVMKL